MHNPVSSLPRSGILLSQFLQETEKEKRKSNRSSKSCQIRKRPLIIKFLRSVSEVHGFSERGRQRLVRHQHAHTLDFNVTLATRGIVIDFAGILG